MWLYQAPVSVFWINLLFYYIFLGFFAYVITANFCYHPAWQEYVVIVWIVSLIFEELRQVLHESGGLQVDFHPVDQFRNCTI